MSKKMLDGQTIQVVCIKDNTYFLTRKGEVYAAGSNEFSQCSIQKDYEKEEEGEEKKEDDPDNPSKAKEKDTTKMHNGVKIDEATGLPLEISSLLADI